jgi:hypothetical protein
MQRAALDAADDRLELRAAAKRFERARRMLVDIAVRRNISVAESRATTTTV